MEKILFFEELYSDRRIEFINRGIELQSKGKNFLYIPYHMVQMNLRYKMIKVKLLILPSHLLARY